MESAKLDRKITLQRATITQDSGSGENVETWATLGPGSIFASRRRASARETLAAAEIAGEVSDVFEIRYDSSWADLDVRDRLVFEGRTYNIASVDEIQRREGFRIGASARAEAP